MEDLISSVFDISDEIKDTRTLSDILNHLTSEVGELADEVMIVNGFSIKPEGADGILGEAVDVMLCAIDIIRKYDTTITPSEVYAVAMKKCDKWKYKSEKLKIS